MKSSMLTALRKILIQDFGYANARGMRRFLAAQQACALLEDLKYCSSDAIGGVMEYRLDKITKAISEVKA